AGADGAQRAVRGDPHVERRLRVEMIRRLPDRQARRLGQARRDDPRVLRMGVEAGPHRGSAERDARELVDGAPGPPDRLLDLSRVAAELLAEADRRGVLQMRAPGLDHGPELLAL